MTTPGHYASSDKSFASSTGNAAARGVILIVVAVLIGIVLLAKGFDGPSTTAVAPAVTTTVAPDVTTTEPGVADTSTTVDSSGTTTTVPAVAPAVSLRPPAEVKVVVANGSGVAGAAGAAKGELTTAGYVAEAKNATTPETELSAIYYIDGYAGEAKAVAEILGGTEALLRAAPADPLALIKSPSGLEDFQIFVILGLDKAIG